MNLDREPLGKIALLVAAVAGLLVAFGIHVSTEQVDAITTMLIAAGPIVTPLLVWWLGRRKTTPLDSPRSAAGEDLVPVSTTTLLPGVGDD